MAPSLLPHFPGLPGLPGLPELLRGLALASLALLGPAHPAPLQGTSPNAFLARGTPTLVVGTAGDERSDRAVQAQAQLVRELVFPRAELVPDVVLQQRLRAGGAWPELPLLYGGPHVNALVAELLPELPFEMAPGRLELGGQRFEGPGVRLIAVLPAAAEGGRPELLLYAGTGTPGVAEINGIPHGQAPILVADAFGPLVDGSWEEVEGGWTARLGTPRRRLEWVARGAATEGARVLFPAILPETEEDPALSRAVAESVAEAARRLAIRAPVEVVVHVHPDRRSKASLTERAGDGHADPEARVLHVVRAPEPALRSLVLHEATHVLAYHAWGPALSPLLGEGLAVWVAGAYQGVPLADWPARITVEPARIDLLLGVAFRRLPEAEAYPLGGLLVGLLVERFGLDAVREHFYGARGETWGTACAAAGTSPPALEQALRDLLRR